MFKLNSSILVLIGICALLLDAQPHLLPMAGGGRCEKGTEYIINSIADLKQNIGNLECIFAAGVSPDEVGLGFYYGTVLVGENSVAAQHIAAPFYQGDYVVKTTCDKNTVFLGTLKVAGISIGTALWELSEFTEATAPEEAPLENDKKYIIMDFRQNVQDICPIEDLSAMLNSRGFLPFRNPPPPVNCFVDIARIVGRDPRDGGFILLAKGMNRDPATGWQTSLIYALKNFDPAIKKDWGYGVSIQVPRSFSYIHHGLAQTFSRFGATGLLPFLMHSKQNMQTAIASNPLVAAFALKSGGLNALEGIQSIPFDGFLSDEAVLMEFAKNALLGQLVVGKLFESMPVSQSNWRSAIWSSKGVKATEGVIPVDESSHSSGVLHPDWQLSVIPLLQLLLTPQDPKDVSAIAKQLEELEASIRTMMLYNGDYHHPPPSTRQQNEKISALNIRNAE